MNVIRIYVVRRHRVDKTRWNALVGEVFVCEQETQIEPTTFITITVTCITATNQGWLIFKVQCLTEYISMVSILCV